VTAAVDHVFVLCSEGGREAETLVRLGLREGSGNTHPGQGTACRRFFFLNAYLELLWVHDPIEAQSEAARATGLWLRWAARGLEASPFGIVLRPDKQGGATDPPFDSWSYLPEYLPSGESIEVAKDVPLSGPALFYLGFLKPPSWAEREPIGHARPVEVLTGVTVWRPPGGGSEALRALEKDGLVVARDGDEPLLELRFEGRGHDRVDLRPYLPLTLSW